MNAHRVLVETPERNRSLGRQRRRWEDNIKIYLRETERGVMDWNRLAQDIDHWELL
jgi:hypothetical protein